MHAATRYNPVMAAKDARRTLDAMEKASEATVAEIKAIQARCDGLEAQNREILTQLRNTQMQLADVSNTLKKVLPELMTKQAAPSTSRSESRQGS